MKVVMSFELLFLFVYYCFSSLLHRRSSHFLPFLSSLFHRSTNVPHSAQQVSLNRDEKAIQTLFRAPLGDFKVSPGVRSLPQAQM